MSLKWKEQNLKTRREMIYDNELVSDVVYNTKH